MVDSYVQIQPDSTGKKLQSYQNTIASNIVEAEGIVQVDTTGTPVPTGTAASPVRIDPTGTTAQPVSGTVTANQGTAGATWPVDVVDEIARELGKVGPTAGATWDVSDRVARILGRVFIRNAADTANVSSTNVGGKEGLDVNVIAGGGSAALNATFRAVAFDIAPAANAYMMVLLNRNSARVLRVYEVNCYISSETAVTGVLLKAALFRVSSTVALSGGVAITPAQMDTNESLSATIDVMTKPTNAFTDVARLKTFLMSGDEAVVATLDADAFASEQFPRDSFTLWKRDTDTKPLTLRTDGTTFQGVAVKNLVGAVGNVGLEILFTDAAS